MTRALRGGINDQDLVTISGSLSAVCDGALGKLLAAIRSRLEKRAGGLAVVGGVRELRGALSVVQNEVGQGKKAEEVALVVGSLAECARLASETAQSAELEAWLAPVVPLCVVAEILVPLLEGDVNKIMAEDEARERLDSFYECLAPLGIARNDVGWMNARLRGAVLYLRVLGWGQKRVPVRVRRAAVMADLRASLGGADSGAGGAGGGSRPTVKLYPSFVLASGATEAGEGHGPRKELFTLISHELTSPWGPEEPQDGFLVSCEAGSTTWVAVPKPGGAKGFSAPPAGFRVVARDGGGAVVAAEPLVGPGLRVANPAQEPFSGLALSIQKPVQPLFVTLPAAGTCYPNPSLVASDALRAAFRFSGWLLGAAVANRVTLDLPLAPALFRLLSDPGWRPTLDEALAHDPDLAASVRSIRAMSRADFSDFLSGEGQALSTSKDAYLAGLAVETLRDGVAWQLQAFRDGLFSVVDRPTMRSLLVCPRTLLETAISAPDDPERDFVLRDHFRVFMDEDFDEKKLFAQAFWEVVDGLDVKAKRGFLRFVTGRDRLPVRNSEVIRVEVPAVPMFNDEMPKVLNSLPQAHTCSNTIELPDYWTAAAHQSGFPNSSLSSKQAEKVKALVKDRLAAKLRLAIEWSSGYDLDDTRVGGGPRPGPTVPMGFHVASSPRDSAKRDSPMGVRTEKMDRELDDLLNGI